MKTIAQSLIVAICLGLVSVVTSVAEANPGHRSTATATFQSSFYTTAEGKLNVALDKDQSGRVEVRLLNSKGNILFMQSISKRQQTSRMRLDVSGLPDGAYQVAITNGASTTLHKITLSTQQASAPSRLIAVR